MSEIKINYKDLMKEINEDVKEGILMPDQEIQILRDEQPVFQEYCPIIDWYYNENEMKEELDTPLEEMYLKEEFSKEEWQNMQKERDAYGEQYESDREKLIKIKVKDALTEMKQMQKLFS